jgi:GTP diphosphokinase / guanosine-3',5'-bis(diphosphate) 3'-diphosphatase
MNETNILYAIEYASEKHKLQRRKGYYKIPYINHPIKVTRLLAECNEKDDVLLCASILHDVLEDTDATEHEILSQFGQEVLDVVKEVTDNMQLPEKERKALQITKAKGLSNKAKKIKIADKICNMRDILVYPLNWRNSRKLRYFEWSKQVIDNCRGMNELLEKLFNEEYDKGIAKFRK